VPFKGPSARNELFCVFVAVDAVYAMAHAIHNMIADVCGTNPFTLCDKLRPAPSGVELLTYIRNVNFTGEKNIKFFLPDFLNNLGSSY